MSDGPPRLTLPTASASVRRRTVWHQARGASAALLGLVVTLLAGAILLGVVPELIDDERAYAAASPCPASTGGTEDCLREVTATVVRTVIRDEAEYDEFSVRLRGLGEASGDVDTGAPGPLLKDLRPGDAVTFTLWQDYVVAVAKDGRSQETADTPWVSRSSRPRWSRPCYRPASSPPAPEGGCSPGRAATGDEGCPGSSWSMARRRSARCCALCRPWSWGRPHRRPASDGRLARSAARGLVVRAPT